MSWVSCPLFLGDSHLLGIFFGSEYGTASVTSGQCGVSLTLTSTLSDSRLPVPIPTVATKFAKIAGHEYVRMASQFGSVTPSPALNRLNARSNISRIAPTYHVSTHQPVRVSSKSLAISPSCGVRARIGFAVAK